MLKILHLNNYLPYTSGVTRYIYQIVKNTKDIFEHEVVCFGGDAKTLFEELQIKYTVINYSGLFSVPSVYNFLWNYCKKNKIDIVHNHHRLFDAVISSIPNKHFKTITTVHSKVYGRKMFSYRADKLISYCSAITDHLIQYFDKPANKIRVMKSFVDESNVTVEVPMNKLKSQLGIAEDKLIVFIGRFSREKGVDILVQAFNELYILDKDISLIMIGEGEEEKYLRNYSLKNQLPVLLIKPQINIYDYYNIADIIVLPSRVDPFPFVMLETGLMKKPFIGSDVDGIPELIKHKFNGVLFPSENVNELVKSFQMILKDKNFLERIAQNLHNEIIEKYTAKKVIPDYIKLYDSL